MATSLIKFHNQKTRGGKKLFWGRAAEDGLPYRGKFAAMYRDDEFEDRTTVVKDARNDYFDTMDPEENARFLEIMDAILNGWFQLVHIERFVEIEGVRTTKHYLEWAEYYREDNSPVAFMSPGMMELRSGQ
jgi:hypothetical protein